LKKGSEKKENEVFKTSCENVSSLTGLKGGKRSEMGGSEMEGLPYSIYCDEELNSCTPLTGKQSKVSPWGNLYGWGGKVGR